MDLSLLPKVELHVHLDCSLSYNLVKKFRPNISFHEYESEFVAPMNCSSLAEYLSRAKAGIEIMQTRNGLEEVTSDLFEQFIKDNVIYAEIRFAPLQHLNDGLSPNEVVGVVNNATDQAVLRTGIEAGIILCTLRHYTEEQSLQTVKLVEEFEGTRVVGFDIAADEHLPLDNHISAFEYAARNNINCTAHAGEAKGAKSVEEVLTKLKPSRIGHGVRSIEDVAVINRLKADHIHLEICPTSNIRTGIFETVDQHNINDLYNKQLSLSINTDGRSISNVSLNEEYHTIKKHFGWKLDHYYKCNVEAVKASFTSESIKIKLLDKLEKAYLK